MKRLRRCGAVSGVVLPSGLRVALVGMQDVDAPALTDPRHQRLLEWELTSPAARQPATAVALSVEIGCSERTLRDWKARPDFQAAWRAGFQAVAGSMERTKHQLDVLYADSVDPESKTKVQSAKLHWDITRAIAPPEPEVVSSRRAKELSDDELKALLSSVALAELVERMGPLNAPVALPPAPVVLAGLYGPNSGAVEASGEAA